MKRYKHTLSYYRLLTADMGELFPIGMTPVLPGDTMQHHTSLLCRLSPLNTPVMHPVRARVHHFYVPNRIVWPEWEDFITGGDGQSTPPVIPTINTSNSEKGLPAYFGLPRTVLSEVNGLPIMAFNKIFNEYYRDQDLVTERALDDVSIPRIAWEKDYFTTARPWASKGPDISIPVGGEDGRWKVRADGNAPQIPTVETNNGDDSKLYVTAAPSDVQLGAADPSAAELFVDAQLAGSNVNINEFRTAFALQRYQEARARYGSRFTEYLRFLGITPSDSRLQRPEFLGGGSARLNFSEVLQTGPNDTTGGPEDPIGIGNMFGHGIGGIRSNRYRKFFEEHGYIITVCSIRPKTLYMTATEREWLKTTKEDYFQKELQAIGQQEIWDGELFGIESKEVFGFQDRYSEYKRSLSLVSGDFRDTLKAWHLGRDIATNPTLNSDFVECDPSKRIFQVTDENVDSLWIMANHHLVGRRMVPRNVTPRVL